MKLKFIPLVIVCAIAAAAAAHAGTATVTLGAVTTYTDGKAITVPVTYNVYQGAQGGTLIKAAGPQSSPVFQIANLTDGTAYCFAGTALAGGVESTQSATVCKTPGPPPSTTPSAPPSISVTVSGAVAYQMIQTTNKFVALAVGTVPAGTALDTSQFINGMCVVDRSKVAWYGSVKPLAVVSPCG